jgi:hypothetical protein
MKLLKFAVIAAALVLSAPMAFATCPTPPTGPHTVFPLAWYDYTPDASCVVANGSASATTACGDTAWATGATTATVAYTFTVNQTGINFWSAGAVVQIIDPTNSASNYIDIYALVTHNGVDTETLLYTIDGTGSDVDCVRKSGYFFDAVYGDTVQIIINSRKPSASATITVGVPKIFGYL